ncbi:protoglobin domain-containing protein [Sphingomonas sp. WKB10]|nr:protoglobin domain-containing protein [Sphingomonas sp. WKB10]
METTRGPNSHDELETSHARPGSQCEARTILRSRRTGLCELPAHPVRRVESAPKALDLFYKKIAATPEVSGFFTSKSVMDHARDKQLDHWSQLFSRELGAGYFEKAEQIGNVHARIGLAPTWYIGGYAMVLEQVIHAVVASSPSVGWPASASAA